MCQSIVRSTQAPGELALRGGCALLLPSCGFGERIRCSPSEPSWAGSIHPLLSWVRPLWKASRGGDAALDGAGPRRGAAVSGCRVSNLHARAVPAEQLPAIDQASGGGESAESFGVPSCKGGSALAHPQQSLQNGLQGMMETPLRGAGAGVGVLQAWHRGTAGLEHRGRSSSVALDGLWRTGSREDAGWHLGEASGHGAVGMQRSSGGVEGGFPLENAVPAGTGEGLRGWLLGQAFLSPAECCL